jgi:RNA polymerase sigma-70 factor (ECF subfamily)
MAVREFQPPCPAVSTVGDAVVTPDRRQRRHHAERAAAPDRFRSIVDNHYDFLWRTIRYLGVADAQAEDAAQQVLFVVARRLDEIAPGAEMSFLFATAVRVASECRRANRRRPVVPLGDADGYVAPSPTAEELVDTRRAQQVLYDIVQAMPPNLRVVFVLSEIEELTLAEISQCVGVPIGTVASRLRRAREKFKSLIRRRVVLSASMRGGR